MHILSTIESVLNFLTHSSEALSPFYKCFVTLLWWRRDTFTENYSARDINHHLKNKAAICLEGILESTKAKFNKNPMGVIAREKTFFSGGGNPRPHELFHILVRGTLRNEISLTTCPHQERECLQGWSETCKGYLLKMETSPLGFDLDTDLLPNSLVHPIQSQP